MTERISIDDLRSPQMSEAQRQMIAAAEANPVTLSEEAVLAAARTATGLSDFGPDDFFLCLQREWPGNGSASCGR